MATQTQNYNFVKPAKSENYNISIFNSNMDNIDSEIKEIEDGLTGHIGASNKHFPSGLVKGDIFYYTGTAIARLPVGTVGQVLKAKADGTLEWGEAGGMTKYKTQNSVFDQTSINPEEYKTVLNISGSGLLTHVNIRFNISYSLQGRMKITVDGGTPVLHTLTTVTTDFYSLEFITFLSFDTSLKIEVGHSAISGSSGVDTKTQVAYLTA